MLLLEYTTTLHLRVLEMEPGSQVCTTMPSLVLRTKPRALPMLGKLHTSRVPYHSDEFYQRQKQEGTAERTQCGLSANKQRRVNTQLKAGIALGAYLRPIKLK